VTHSVPSEPLPAPDVVWTVTDHLGTPRIQTDSTGAIVWHAEHEPYGRIYLLREGEGRHQPLRFPGQEAEQLGLNAPNGSTDRNYNIFRWYRAGEGRYTQGDPLGLIGDVNLYRYSMNRPLLVIDRLGMAPCEKDPSLVGCMYMGSTCCAQKCIDDLQWMVCQTKKNKKDFTIIGVVSGASVGAGVGLSIGGPVGVCVGAVVGGVVGGVGGYTLGKEWGVAEDLWWIYFKDCMAHCGQSCKKDDQCHLKNQFNELTKDL
ncbi:MAG: RHS domain-containing protein, partial [Acidobacteria bacterium]|nr:RHS domain-containing protein [Acidobacteriota bacterium]